MPANVLNVSNLAKVAVVRCRLPRLCRRMTVSQRNRFNALVASAVRVMQEQPASRSRGRTFPRVGRRMPDQRLQRAWVPSDNCQVQTSTWPMYFNTNKLPATENNLKNRFPNLMYPKLAHVCGNIRPSARIVTQP